MGDVVHVAMNDNPTRILRVVPGDLGSGPSSLHHQRTEL